MAKAKELKFVSASQGKTGGGVTYIKAKELAEKGFTGVVATGVFTGTLPNQFNADKPNIKIEALDENEDGTRETIVINAAGNLTYRMSSVPVGTIVQISYLGQEKMKSDNKALNGKLVHQFDVAVAE
jgi:hypothetical protein